MTSFVRTRFYLLLFLFGLVPLVVHAQIDVRVGFDVIPNLTYQLDCVSDLSISCSEANFRELWKREFLKTPRDREMLEEWRRVRIRYSSDIEPQHAIDTPLPIRGGYVNLFAKARIAGLQASDLDDYGARLDLLTTPADRATLERIVRHFHQPFVRWWQSEARERGAKFVGEVGALLRSPGIAEQLRRFRSFYAAALPPGYQVKLALLYRPNLVRESTNGEQLEGYSLAEFLAEERPEDRLDVVIHELCHFLYWSAPPAEIANLQQRFLDTRRATAMPAYNLLNETLATAFGQGMIARDLKPKERWEKYRATKLSFYTKESLDRSAKALLPWLDAWLASGKTLHDESFVAEYISQLEKEFGELLTAPKLNLNEMILVADNKYGTTLRHGVRSALEVSSSYSSEGAWTEPNFLDDYKNKPRLPAIFIVHPDNIAKLNEREIVPAADARRIADEYKTKGSVLYAAERAPFTYVYLLVAKDAAGINDLIGKLARADAFRGVYTERRR